MEKSTNTHYASRLSDTVLDVQSALNRLGSDQELLSDMIGFFVEDGPRLMVILRTAAEAQDAPGARKAAHALKGLILGCGGVRAARTAQSVEDAAYAGDVDEITPLIDSLSHEVDALVEASLPYCSRPITRPQD